MQATNHFCRLRHFIILSCCALLVACGKSTYNEKKELEKPSLTNGYYAGRRTVWDNFTNDLGEGEVRSFTEIYTRPTDTNSLDVVVFNSSEDLEKGVSNFNENGWTSTERFDMEGNLLRKQSYEYYENGLLKSITFTDAQSPENSSLRVYNYEAPYLKSTMTYDANNKLSQTETYTYNRDGQLISSIINFEASASSPSASPLECEQIHDDQWKKVECYRIAGAAQERRHFSSKLVAYRSKGDISSSELKFYQTEGEEDIGKVIRLYKVFYAYEETNSGILNLSLFKDAYYPSE